MLKTIRFFIAFSCIFCGTYASTRDAQLTNTTGYNYNYMYPYMTNKMRTALNPGVSPSQNSNLIDTVVRTEPLSTPRRVVSRKNRGASTTNTHRTPATASARAAMPATGGASIAQSNRRVVARSGMQTTAMARRTSNQSRAASTDIYRTAVDTTIPTTMNTERISSTRCLTDYTDCMNKYCKREGTKYNRCYCSARLSQIDSEYQTSINDLIIKILTIQNTNKWSDEEMNEYWMDTVGKYSGENSWTNLDNALNIDWASTESRVRGQSAYTTGHEYCIQHLRGCYYMAANLRDAYQSEISRDCANYEQSLQKIKSAAESIVESYK